MTLKFDLSIQTFFDSRMGKSRKQLITSCWAAIKQDNLYSLSKIVASNIRMNY